FSDGSKSRRVLFNSKRCAAEALGSTLNEAQQYSVGAAHNETWACSVTRCSGCVSLRLPALITWANSRIRRAWAPLMNQFKPPANLRKLPHRESLLNQ